MRKLLSLVYGVLVSCPRKALEPSLDPDQPRKGFLTRWLDLVYLRIRDGWLFQQYHGVRCDLKGHNVNDVVTEGQIYGTLLPVAKKRGAEYVSVLDDKYLFESYLSNKLDRAVIPVFAHINCGKCFVNEQPCTREELRETLKTRSVFMAKAVTGLCGHGIKKVSHENSAFMSGGEVWKLDEHIDNGDYLIFQDVVVNHPDIAKINPTTLNTLRVTTCWKDGKVELFDDAVLRMGRKGASVDNFFQGGLALGITKEGKGYPYAVRHTREMIYSKHYEHPDSGIVFDGYELPMYCESVELAMRAHEFFPSIPSVGWDVAITSEGPKLLEGNCDWDICFLQAVLNHRLAKRIGDIYGKRV